MNVFKHSGVLFRFSLAVALSLTTLCFSWTIYDEGANIEYRPSITDEVIEVIPQRFFVPPPPPPKLPPSVIEEVEEDEITEEPPEWESEELDDEVVFEPILPKPKEEVILVPPPLPKEEDVPNEIIAIVEEMPRFPGCENEGSKAEKQMCAERALLRYLSQNLKYPNIARENGVEGRVYIRFVVERDGSVTGTEILRDIGAGCGKAALAVVDNMNNLPQKWTPGRQRGKAVRVLYTLPVTFKLQR